MRYRSIWTFVAATVFAVAVSTAGCTDCGANPGAGGSADDERASESAAEASEDDASGDDSAEGSSTAEGSDDATPALVQSDDLPDDADRIIALAPNVTEILYAMGLEDRVVAVSQHSDYPPEVADKPSVGNFQNPDFESMLSHEPDIVVGTTSGGDESIATRLDEANIPYFFVRMATIEETLGGIRKIGGAIGFEERAEQLAREMTARMEEISEDAQRGSSEDAPRVLVVYGREPVVAAGPGTFGHQLIERAGGVNVLADAGSKYPRVDVEKIIELDPQVILDAAGMAGDASSSDFWQQFNSVSAVREGRVEYLSDNAVMRPGPRLPDGLEIFVEAIHD